MNRPQKQVAIGAVSLLAVLCSMAFLRSVERPQTAATATSSSSSSSISGSQSLNPELPQHVRTLLQNGNANSSASHHQHLLSNSNNSSLRRKQTDQEVVDGSSINIDNSRELTSCISSWHMSILPNEPNTCTNSDYYPPDWDQPAVHGFLFHENQVACCIAYFGPGKYCGIVDACPDDDGSSMEEQSETAAGGDVSVPSPKPTTKKQGRKKPTNEPTRAPTNEPTTKPTRAPTTGPTKEPTGSVIVPNYSAVGDESECGDWHPSITDPLTCTNGKIYPPSWTSVPAFFFKDGASCCWGYYDSDCTLKDECSTDPTMEPTFLPTLEPTREPTKNPTKEPTREPTKEPTKAPTRTPTNEPTNNPIVSESVSGGDESESSGCEDWHPSIADPSTCTNGKSYPPSWANVPSYFFKTGDECCQGYYGSDCTLKDECSAGDATPDSTVSDPTNPPTNAPTTVAPTDAPTPEPTDEKMVSNSASGGGDPSSCSQKKWHIAIISSGQKCTNDQVYPKEWDTATEEHKKTLFFDSAEMCCTFLFSGLDHCTVVDICEEEEKDEQDNVVPSIAPTEKKDQTELACDLLWYPAMHKAGTCTNDINYPPEFNGLQNADSFFAKTGQECCQKYFGSECPLTDTCASASPETTPPPNGPTDAGTVPTDEVDQSESACGGWYPSMHEPACTNDINHPPQLNDFPEFFSKTGDECCEEHFSAGCPQIDLCASTSTDTTPPPNNEVEPSATECGDWYPSMYEPGSCVNNLDFPPELKDFPEFFSKTGDECCAAHFSSGCPLIDACASTSPETTPPPKNEVDQSTSECGDWYPSMHDQGSCTNDPDVPPEIGDFPEFLSKTGDECCVQFFSSGCPLIDTCVSTSTETTTPPTIPETTSTTVPETSVLTSKPTDSPGSSPTVSSTSSATSLPTVSPTIKPTSSPSASPITKEIEYVTTSAGGDNFESEEHPAGPIPWVVTDPPQWIIDDTVKNEGQSSLRNVAPVGLGASSDLTLHVKLSTTMLISCRAKIDVGMPFDMFQFVVDGTPRMVLVQPVEKKWITIATGIPPGDHTIQFRVINNDLEIPIPRTEKPYGTGFVWLDQCSLLPT